MSKKMFWGSFRPYIYCFRTKKIEKIINYAQWAFQTAFAKTGLLLGIWALGVWGPWQNDDDFRHTAPETSLQTSWFCPLEVSPAVKSPANIQTSSCGYGLSTPQPPDLADFGTSAKNPWKKISKTSTKDFFDFPKAQKSSFVAQKKNPYVRIDQVIRGSLWKSLRPRRVPASIIHLLENQWKHLRNGDKVSLLYRQEAPLSTLKKHRSFEKTTLLYGALRRSSGQQSKLFYFHPPHKKSTHLSGLYNEKGEKIGFSKQPIPFVKKEKFLTPVRGRISSKFGVRIHPISQRAKMHYGVDYAAPSGTPIRAAASGYVAKAVVHHAYGRYVVLKHSSTLSTAYAHMSRFSPTVQKKTFVQKGDIIGYVGASGRATGPHLHFEVFSNNVRVNPMPFFKALPTTKLRILPKSTPYQLSTSMRSTFASNMKKIIALYHNLSDPYWTPSLVEIGSFL